MNIESHKLQTDPEYDYNGRGGGGGSSGKTGIFNSTRCKVMT